MKYQTIFILTVIYGCGEAPSDTSNTVAQPNLPVAQTSTEAPVQTEEVSPVRVSQSAKLIASVEDLPRCWDEDKGNLVYVLDVAMFYVCDVSVWRGINLKGADGVNGLDGAKGEDGEDGVDGTNGVNGINGAKGADGQVGIVSDEVWYHPVSGKKWFLGNVIRYMNNPGTLYDILKPGFICPIGSRLPKETEYRDALSAGIWTKFGAKQPLLVGLGSIYNTVGTTDFYNFKVGNNSMAINDLAINATALCLVE